MKKRMEEISVENAPKTVCEPSQPSGVDKLPSVSCASKTHHLPEKFAAAAINGEYVDFSDVLSALCVLRSSQSNEGILRSLSGDVIAIARPQRKRLVDSFDLWLQVWTKYEMEIAIWSWQHIESKFNSPTVNFVGLAYTCSMFRLAHGWPRVKIPMSVSMS